jgi:regulator of sirC expression with transglutaminase-like and TPR domain
MTGSATERFTALVELPEADLPLDESALLIAAHANPELDVAAQLARLDAVADRLPDASAAGVASLLFDELGLRGNADDYTDPRNSYLDQVLDRRLGIPISLAVLMMEIGRRAGVTIEGIGMPGHFLVRGDGELRDPFRGGRPLGVSECEELFHGLFGTDAPFSADLLAPTGRHAILARMLANLRNSYAKRGDTRALSWVARLRLAIPGVSPTELAELSRLLANLGRFDEAAGALEELAASDTVTRDTATELVSRARTLRARLN